MLNREEYTLNGIKVTVTLNTRKHKWLIWFDSPLTESPDMELTQAKGDAVVEFLEELTRIVRDRND